MGFKRNFREFILRFDLFSTNANLRVRGEPSYQSVQCGLFSIFLIGLFGAIFFSTILDVFNKVNITATTSTSDIPSSETYISSINFAISIENTDVNMLQYYFDFKIDIKDHVRGTNGSSTTIYLERCTENSWSTEGTNIKNYFQSLSMEDMFCAPAGSNLSIMGYQGKDNWSELQIVIEKCNPTINNCSSTAELNTFIDTHLNQNDYFKVRLFFLDSIFSPEQPIPVSKTIERDIFMSFTDLLGCRAEITLGHYTITTDQSIWPVANNHQETGNYITGYQSSTTGLRSRQYVRIGIQKSTLQLQITRSYDKLDVILSYIGGLFSLIFFVLYFFFGSFNQYRYELMVAENTFTYNGDGNKTGKQVEERDMGILGYVKYQVYDWMKMLGVKMDWQEMKKMDEVREEATQQLDVRYITKKMQHYDRALTLIVDESLLAGICLMKPTSLQQAKKRRKLIEYYGKIANDPHNFNAMDSQTGTSMNTSIVDEKVVNPLERIRNSPQHPSNQFINNQPQAHSELMSIQQIRNANGDSKQLSSSTVFNIKKYDANKILQTSSNEQKEAVSSAEDIRKERCCCCYVHRRIWGRVENLLDDPLDSDDERAEQTLFSMYERMSEVNPKRAKEILSNIPEQLRLKIESMNNRRKFMIEEVR